MEGFVREVVKERVAVIYTGGEEAVGEDGGRVGVREGRRRLTYRRWKSADRGMLLMWVERIAYGPG